MTNRTFSLAGRMDIWEAALSSDLNDFFYELDLFKVKGRKEKFKRLFSAIKEFNRFPINRVFPNSFDTALLLTDFFHFKNTHVEELSESAVLAEYNCCDYRSTFVIDTTNPEQKFIRLMVQKVDSAWCVDIKQTAEGYLIDSYEYPIKN